MRTLVGPLMALALLVLIIVHAEPAQATHSASDNETELWRQITAPSPSGSYLSVQTWTSGILTLNAGDDVYVYAGSNSFGNGVGVELATNSARLYTLTKECGLTVGPEANSAELVACYNTSSTYTPFYGIVRASVKTTGAYRLVTISGCTFGCPEGISTGWITPPGKSLSSLFGYAGSWTSGAGHVLRANLQLQGEAGIMASQTSKAPASSKLSWTRMNPPAIFAQLDGAGSGGNVAEIAQGFPAPTGGAYMEITRIGMFGSGNWNCVGTLRISITNTLSVPWNNLAEAAAVQVSWTLSGGAPNNNYVTVDWVNAVISEDAGSVSFGTPTWSIGGSTVTGENLKVLAPLLTPSQGEYYARAFWDNSGCLPSAYVMSRYSGGDSYSGGTAWTVSGGAWVQQPGQDFGGILLNSYGGNRTHEWKLNSSALNTGGATYLYVGEHQRDSNLGLATPSSSWGGSALFGKDLWELSGSGSDCVFGGISNSLCMLREYRLGYMPRPHASSQGLTITMNMNGMGRNLVYVGTLQNQPTQTHIAPITWDHQASSTLDLTVYQLWSTDDYFALANFTVRECANADCTEFGPALSNVSYNAKICGGIRNAAGTPDANGTFNISGQDLPGCEIIITLTGSGYAETAWSVQITTGGVHTYTIGIFKAGTSSGSAQLAATSVIFTGNMTRYIPDRVAINITRGRNADLFVGLDKVDATSGLVQHNVIRATYWKAFDGNTFQFYYPNKAKSTSQEIGLHVLWVMNDTGVVLNHTKFFILPVGGNAGDYDVTITADFLRGIEEKGYISAQQTFQSQYQASILAVQKSVRDQVYEDFKKVSDYGWFVIGFLLFLATVRAFKR